MIRIIVVAAIVAAFALAAIGSRDSTPPALACSGGIGALEDLASQADLILLGVATDVGDEVNRAPTIAPVPTQTPFPASPVSPPVPTIEPLPTRQIALAGIQATINVEKVYVGAASDPYIVGDKARAAIERDLRRLEAGSYAGTSCAIDAFTPRYQLDGTYLMFIEAEPDLTYVMAAFRVRDGQLTLGEADSGLWFANQNVLYMEFATYDRFFAGIPYAYEHTDMARMFAGTVPLRNVLTAVADIRGDTSIIIPPHTGSAGLRGAR